MSAQESCEVSELGDMREERDPAPTEFGDEPYPDRHGLADEEERLIGKPRRLDAFEGVIASPGGGGRSVLPWRISLDSVRTLESGIPL